ncbi:MAG: prepilin-type N-terminal cleavage/methylation domain-containing protein [Alphaproteobacteria bacterium]
MRSHCRHGFTLIELAIVLVIVSLMTGFAMKATQSTASVNCYDQTRVQLRTISTSIQNYVRTQSKYPMPARLNAGVTDPTFGKSDSGANLDHCDTGGNCSAGKLWFGALPFATLGLPPSYAADCWGNKFRYVVTDGLTGGMSSAGAITVRTGTIGSSTPLTSTAAFAVISHGQDSLGACARNYTGASSACNCNTQEADGTVTRVDKENCDTTKPNIFSTTFNNGANAPNFFDDLVIYQNKAGSTSSCLPTDMGWNNGGAGTNCGAPVSELADGVSIQLTNSNAGWQGTATVKCSAGVVTLQGSPSPVCTATSCAAGLSYGWSPCSGTLSSNLANGATGTINNSVANYSGSAPVKCSGGALQSNGTASCIASCPSQGFSWSGLVSGCSATQTAQTYPWSGTLQSTAGNRAGTMALTCTSNGTWSQGLVSCTMGPCAAGTGSWSSHCSGPYGTLSAGGTQTVTNSASGYTGTETVTCASDGSGTITPSAQVCNANCAAVGSTSWLTSCSGSVPALNGGASTTVTNSAANYTGSETATCSNGTVTYSNPSCTSTSCSATTASWTGTASGCSGPVTLGTNGSNQTVTNSASGHTGSETATCNSGTWSYSSPNCTLSGCSASLVSWSGGTCSVNPGAQANGYSTTLNNTASGYTGSATVTCWNNAWTTDDESCQSLNCSAGTVTWKELSCAANPSTCTASAPAITNGGNASVTDHTTGGGPYTATAYCNNGVLSVPNGPCNCPPLFSDIRLKTGIECVGRTNGFNIYEFSYRNDPAGHRYRGVMAQEVMGVPGAVVTMPNGYYAVNYSVLGVPFTQVR